MPTSRFHLEHEPFIGYRLALAPMADSSVQTCPAPSHHAVRALLAGQRSVAVSLREAVAVYEAMDRSPRASGEPFPIRFTPVRCRRGRALPFERVALSGLEILYLVHDGFFGSVRCREAAIAAVTLCGALPVPALALPPLARHCSRATAERYVDTLIDAEPELHVHPD
jgi:hypothetical protein